MQDFECLPLGKKFRFQMVIKIARLKGRNHDNVTHSVILLEWNFKQNDEIPFGIYFFLSHIKTHRSRLFKGTCHSTPTNIKIENSIIISYIF